VVQWQIYYQVSFLYNIEYYVIFQHKKHLIVMIHCDKRGSELICGSWSHVFKYEQGKKNTHFGFQVDI
jgi:hypothetical protein